MTLFLTVCITLFAFFRLKVLMLFFQQEEYNGRWFLDYAKQNGRLIDKKLVPCLVVLAVLAKVHVAFLSLLIPLLAFFVWREKKVLTQAKRTLAMTQRVKRIMAVALGLVVLLCAMCEGLDLPVIMMAVIIEALPFVLVGANALLSPVEAHIQKRFLKEAKENLARCHPVVIGITGSYGKTSTKHILGHILSSYAPTLWTPGSVNTKMGICRVIREKLTPEHRYFIVEMGAYFKGSIERLCRFVNPTCGIITAIGQAHYEHFTSQEAIAEAKFELGHWVDKNKGTLVIGTNQIDKKFIPKGLDVVKVGDTEKIHISGAKQDENGISFTYYPEKGDKVVVRAPIYGLHHAGNIALAVTLALKVGVPMKTVLAALKTLPQINHRLEVLHSGAITIIDDAYNSNVDGFLSALDLLKKLKKTRAILITPGMIELGAVHTRSHQIVGERAGEVADVVLAVLPDRMPSFIQGFEKTASKNQVLLKVNSFQQARDWMQQNALPGDVILLENDLLDLYETTFSL